ncbi:MAG TPA: DNA-3-methyladenine glycosylase, partial [Saprospiraceae bacterium]|nr:DNA-3-methyladenine glycosylase [Saprospiraceae bacterium]
MEQVSKKIRRLLYPYNMLLSPEFYRHPDVVYLAQALLGKYVVTELEGQYVAGKIVETEAYRAPEDRASHAFDYRRTGEKLSPLPENMARDVA